MRESLAEILIVSRIFFRFYSPQSNNIGEAKNPGGLWKG
jgi:hypothetical protein